MLGFRRDVVLGAAVAALLVLGAAPASAEPTCSDFEALAVVVHGQHIVRDYVTGGAVGGWPPGGSLGEAIAGSGAVVPGGPGPGFHFEHGFAPGASFCLSQAQSPGFHASL